MLNIFKYHAVSDDLAIIMRTEQEGIKKPKLLKRILMMYLGQAYWEDELWLARLISMSIHLAVCVLIYFAFGHNSVSFLASLLFLIHPANTESWVWLSAKGYSTATMYCLLSTIFPILSIFFFVVPGMMCVSGIFFPLIFLFSPGIVKVLAILAPYAVLQHSKWIFNKEKNAKLKGYECNTFALNLGLWKFVIALKFYGYYLVNCVFGMHYCFYQSYMDDYIDTEEGVKKGKRLDLFFFVGLLSALSIIYCLASGISHISLYGLIWATITIGMFCNFISTGQQYIANRYYYLPNVGLMIFVSGLVINYPILIGLIFGLYISRLIPSILQYSNVYWHFFYQIFDEPEFYYSWVNMGNLHFNRGQFKRATGDYLQSLSLRRDNFKALFNLSSCYIAMKNLNEAVRYFEAAKEADILGQEKKAEGIIKDRMELFNYLSQAKNVTLNISDIPVVS